MSDPQRVQRMFDGIARRYDAFNTVASLGRDESWRRLAARIAAPEPVERGLDAAAGTGKLSAALAARVTQVTALDFSAPMLVRGGPDLAARGLSERIQRVQGDVLALPFPDATFDCATIGFGLRNLADIPLGLREFRVCPADAHIVRPRAPSAEQPTASARHATGLGPLRRPQRLPIPVRGALPRPRRARLGNAAFTNVGYRGLMLRHRHPLGRRLLRRGWVDCFLETAAMEFLDSF